MSKRSNPAITYQKGMWQAEPSLDKAKEIAEATFSCFADGVLMD